MSQWRLCRRVCLLFTLGLGLGYAVEAVENSTDAQAKRYISCSEQDLLYVIEGSALKLKAKFDGAMDDVKLMSKLIVEANRDGGTRNPVLRDDMCCCNTEDWAELGRTSPWAGFHDCNENRKNELFFGNVSMDGGHNMFQGTRTIDTDLAWLSPTSSIFPWVIDRQTYSFDRDGFYAAAWIGTGGEVWSYYPGFNKIWPGHYFGDFIGGDYNGREDLFVKPTTPKSNPLRRPVWTPPYVDPAGSGNMISAITPLYFEGEFRGHAFRDEFVASMGIDILLVYMESLVAAVKPTANALPLVVDDLGHLVSAPQDVVESIFGPGMTLEKTIQCAGQGDSDAISQQQISCKISSSDTGDWKQLMEKLLAEPRGTRRLLRGLRFTSIGGVEEEYMAGLYRWGNDEDGSTPSWNSVVLVPVSELENAVRWKVPETLEAKTDIADGVEVLEFTFTNIGSIDLLFRLRSIPHYATVLRTDPPQHSELVHFSHLPAGSSVVYTIELEAKKTSGRGTHSQNLVWELRDDAYPDCAVQQEVSMVVNFNVNDETILSESWFLWGALGFAFLLGVGITSFMWRTGKSAMDVLLKLATSTVPQMIGFVMDVLDLGSDIASCALIWTVDLAVITETMKLAYVIGVSIGAVPSLFMIYNRVRGLIGSMKLASQPDPTAAGKPRPSVVDVENGNSSNIDTSISIRDLILEEMHLNKLRIREADLMSLFFRSLLLVLILEDLVMLVINIVVFAICFGDTAFVEHRLSTIMMLAGMTNALSVGFKLSDVKKWILGHSQEHKQLRNNQEQFKHLLSLAEAPDSSDQEIAIDLIALLTEAQRKKGGLPGAFGTSSLNSGSRNLVFSGGSSACRRNSEEGFDQTTLKAAQAVIAARTKRVQDAVDNLHRSTSDTQQPTSAAYNFFARTTSNKSLANHDVGDQRVKCEHRSSEIELLTGNFSVNSTVSDADTQRNRTNSTQALLPPLFSAPSSSPGVPMLCSSITFSPGNGGEDVTVVA